MSPDALAAAMLAELERQGEDPLRASPWVVDLEGGNVMVDGIVDLRALAEAVLRVLEA